MFTPKIPLMNSRCRIHYQIQICIPACLMSSEYFYDNFSVYSVRLKNLWMDRIALKTFTSNSRKLSWRKRRVITTSLACVAAYGVPFPPKFNVPFYIVLCTICPTFCVCHLSLHSWFNFLHSTFTFDLCNIQVFAFVIQLFHKQQSSFRIRSSSSVECIFIFSHPTLSICPLSFRFCGGRGFVEIRAVFPESSTGSQSILSEFSFKPKSKWLVKRIVSLFLNQKFF